MTKLIYVDIDLTSADAKKLEQVTGIASCAVNPFVADWLTRPRRMISGELKQFKSDLLKIDVTNRIPKMPDDLESFTSCWLSSEDIKETLNISRQLQIDYDDFIRRTIFFNLDCKYPELPISHKLELGIFDGESHSILYVDLGVSTEALYDVIGAADVGFNELDYLRMTMNYIPLLKENMDKQIAVQEDLKKEIAYLRRQVQNLRNLDYEPEMDSDDGYDKEIKESLQQIHDDINEYGGAKPVSSIVGVSRSPNQKNPSSFTQKKITPSTLGRKLAQKLNRTQVFSYYQICEALIALGMAYNPGKLVDIIRLTDKGKVYGRYQHRYTEEELNSPLERTKTRWAEEIMEVLLAYFQANDHINNPCSTKAVTYHRTKAGK